MEMHVIDGSFLPGSYCCSHRDGRMGVGFEKVEAGSRHNSRWRPFYNEVVANDPATKHLGHYNQGNANTIVELLS